LITPLKRIQGTKGTVLHGLKQSAPGFDGFGEAYFSTVNQGSIKGWRKHKQMLLNIMVPSGSIRFVLRDDRNSQNPKNSFREFVLGTNHYSRLTIPPGIWMAFQGLEPGLNMLLNIASIEHDPQEGLTVDLSQIPYSWEKPCEY